MKKLDLLRGERERIRSTVSDMIKKITLELENPGVTRSVALLEQFLEHMMKDQNRLEVVDTLIANLIDDEAEFEDEIGDGERWQETLIYHQTMLNQLIKTIKRGPYDFNTHSTPNPTAEGTVKLEVITSNDSNCVDDASIDEIPSDAHKQAACNPVVICQKLPISISIHALGTQNRNRTPKRFNTCVDCNLCFINCKTFKKHRSIVHRDDKPYKCQICSFSTKPKHHLVKHQSTHKKTITTRNGLDGGFGTNSLASETGDDVGDDCREDSAKTFTLQSVSPGHIIPLRRSPTQNGKDTSALVNEMGGEERDNCQENSVKSFTQQSVSPVHIILRRINSAHNGTDGSQLVTNGEVHEDNRDHSYENLDQESVVSSPTSQLPLTCCVCDASFDTRNHLMVHVRTRQCIAYEDPFALEKIRMIDAVTVSKEQSVVGKGSPTRTSGPARHILSVMNEQETYASEMVASNESELHDRDFICNKNNRLLRLSTRRYKKLDKHVRMHKGTSTFRCQQCNDRFSKQVDLENHWLQLHLDLAVSICLVCQRSFAQQRLLIDHYGIDHPNMYQQYKDRFSAAISEKEISLTASKSVQGLTASKSVQGLTASKSVPGLTASKSVPGLTASKSVPGLTASKSVPGLTASKSVPGLTASKSVPGLTASKSVPGLTASKSVPGLTASKSVPGLTASKSVPGLTASKSVPGLTASKSVPGLTASKSVPGLTASKSVPGLTASKSVPGLTASKSVPGLTASKSVPGLTASKSVPGLTASKSVPGLTASKSVPGLTASKSVPGLTASKSVPGLTASKSVPGLTASKSVPGLTASKSVPGLTASKSVPGLTASKSVPGLTASKSVPGLTASKSVPGLTASKSVPGLTASKSVPGLTASKSVPGLTASKSVPGLTASKSVPGLTASKSVRGLTASKSVRGLTARKSVRGLTASKSVRGLTASKSVQLHDSNPHPPAANQVTQNDEVKMTTKGNLNTSTSTSVQCQNESKPVSSLENVLEKTQSFRFLDGRSGGNNVDGLVSWTDVVIRNSDCLLRDSTNSVASVDVASPDDLGIVGTAVTETPNLGFMSCVQRCDNCVKAFATHIKQALNRLRNHPDRFPFTCCLCPYVCQTYMTLQNHLQHSHAGRECVSIGKRTEVLVNTKSNEENNIQVPATEQLSAHLRAIEVTRTAVRGNETSAEIHATENLTEARAAENGTGDRPPTESETGDRSPTESETGDRPPTESETGDRRPTESETGDRPPTESGTGDRPPTESETGDRPPTESGTGDRPPTESGTGDRPPTESGTGYRPPTESGTGDRRPTESGTGDRPPTESGTGDRPPTKSGTGDRPPTESGTGDRPPTESGTGDRPPTESGTGDRATRFKLRKCKQCPERFESLRDLRKHTKDVHEHAMAFLRYMLPDLFDDGIDIQERYGKINSVEEHRVDKNSHLFFNVQEFPALGEKRNDLQELVPQTDKVDECLDTKKERSFPGDTSTIKATSEYQSPVDGQQNLKTELPDVLNILPCIINSNPESRKSPVQESRISNLEAELPEYRNEMPCISKSSVQQSYIVNPLYDLGQSGNEVPCTTNSNTESRKSPIKRSYTSNSVSHKIANKQPCTSNSNPEFEKTLDKEHKTSKSNPDYQKTPYKKSSTSNSSPESQKTLHKVRCTSNVNPKFQKIAYEQPCTSNSIPEFQKPPNKDSCTSNSNPVPQKTLKINHCSPKSSPNYPEAPNKDACTSNSNPVSQKTLNNNRCTSNVNPESKKNAYKQPCTSNSIPEFKKTANKDPSTSNSDPESENTQNEDPCSSNSNPEYLKTPNKEPCATNSKLKKRAKYITEKSKHLPSITSDPLHIENLSACQTTSAASSEFSQVADVQSGNEVIELETTDVVVIEKQIISKNILCGGSGGNVRTFKKGSGGNVRTFKKGKNSTHSTKTKKMRRDAKEKKKHTSTVNIISKPSLWKSTHSKPKKFALNDQQNSKNIKPFQCALCQKRYGRVKKLRKHVEKHHPNGKRKKCCVCDVKIKKRNEKRAVCDKCWNKMRKEIEMEYRPDEDSIPFACTVCEKRFALESELETHSLQNHNDGSPQKILVSEELVTASDPSEEKHHANGKRKKCNVCDVKIKKRNEKRAMCDKCWNKIRKEIEMEYRPDEDSMPFACPVCQKRFALESELETHSLRIHNDGLVLEECGTTTYLARVCTTGPAPQSRSRSHEKSETEEANPTEGLSRKRKTPNTDTIVFDSTTTDEQDLQRIDEPQSEPGQTIVFDSTTTDEQDLQRIDEPQSEPGQTIVFDSTTTDEQELQRIDEPQSEPGQTIVKFNSTTTDEQDPHRIDKPRGATTRTTIFSSGDVYACKKCLKYFHTISHLACHNRIDCRSKNFQCGQCCRGFYRRSDLTNHVRHLCKSNLAANRKSSFTEQSKQNERMKMVKLHNKKLIRICKKIVIPLERVDHKVREMTSTENPMAFCLTGKTEQINTELRCRELTIRLKPIDSEIKRSINKCTNSSFNNNPPAPTWTNDSKTSLVNDLSRNLVPVFNHLKACTLRSLQNEQLKSAKLNENSINRICKEFTIPLERIGHGIKQISLKTGQDQ